MQQIYDEVTVGERGKRHWLEVVQKVVWRAAADGEALDPAGLAQALAAELGISLLVARGWVAGVDVLAQYATADLGQGDALDEEDDALAASRRATLPLFEARLQTRIDRFEAEHRGTTGPSGERLGSQGRRSRIRASLLGRLALRRRWYVDPAHGGFSPAEQALGLPAQDFTARLSEVATMTATTVSEEMAAELVGCMLGVPISKHAVQRLVHERGQFALQQDQAQAQMHAPFDESGLMREVERPHDAAREAPEVAYLEIDGVIPMTRDLDQARSAPVTGARGGKGLRYTMVGREVKNAVLYGAESCAKEMPSRGSLLEKTYVSHLGHWSGFARSVWVQMRRLRFDEASKLVLLSDGAEWIRRLAEWLPCEAILILDLFHAKHRVWETSRALWGERGEQTTRWAKRQCERIEQGRVDKVLATLERLERKGTVVPKVEQLHTYFTNNLDRMNYPSYRAAGYRVTTAGVESANYHVTGARLKQQGMRWSQTGASEMALLRADLFNGSWRERTRAMLRRAA